MDKPRAFTLIELLIVCAILAILSVLGVVNFSQATHRAKMARAKADLVTIRTALESYRTDCNAYPPDIEGFSAFIVTRSITTPVAYLSSAASLRDPFNNLQVAVDQWWMRNYRYMNVRGRQIGMKAMGSTRHPNDWLRIPLEHYRRAEAMYGDYVVASHKIGYKDNFKRDENGATKAMVKWHEFYRKLDGEPKFLDLGELIVSQRGAFHNVKHEGGDD